MTNSQHVNVSGLSQLAYNREDHESRTKLLTQLTRAGAPVFNSSINFNNMGGNFNYWKALPFQSKPESSTVD